MLALCLRVALLAADVFPFNADEAIVGLMARHILAGTWPTFFYGQAYLGSLDAAFVAAAFALLGETLLAIRIVQTLLFLGTILTTMALTREMGFSILVCTLAGLLLAIPSVNVTLYTTVSLGGYGEALLLGNLILLATLRLIRRP
ncbi:MAG: putative rane protein, partial [Anaerolineales bacterium]|nr:putative rane protein [Anaerolineales bacterium]